MYEKKVLVIDHESYFLKIKKIGEDTTANIHFLHASTEKIVIEILTQLLENKNLSLPDLIIIDINFIITKNIDILTFIKENILLQSIPIIVLGENDSSNKLSNSFENYSNCWLQKPYDNNEFEKVIKSIFFFWFKIAKLPNKNYN